MRLIDEHWIAYPHLIAGELGLVERAKLKLLRRPVVRYLDVIMRTRREQLDGRRERRCRTLTPSAARWS